MPLGQQQLLSRPQTRQQRFLQQRMAFSSSFFLLVSSSKKALVMPLGGGEQSCRPAQSRVLCHGCQKQELGLLS
jgi:hypothetical protein